MMDEHYVAIACRMRKKIEELREQLLGLFESTEGVKRCAASRRGCPCGNSHCC